MAPEISEQGREHHTIDMANVGSRNEAQEITEHGTMVVAKIESGNEAVPMATEIAEQGSENIEPGNESAWKNHSVYKVPAFMAKMHEGAFTPKLISMGPYHHGNPDLLPMEEHKRRALKHFLKRTGKPRQHYLDALQNVEHKLVACYDWSHVSAPESAEFLKMMLFDGCFLIELHRSTCYRQTAYYEQNDPIFNNIDAPYAYHLYNDMIMVENQIPLLVLHTLLGDVPFSEVNKLVLELFDEPPTLELPGLGLHLLDVRIKGKLGEQSPSVEKEEEPASRRRHLMPGLSCCLQDSEGKSSSHHASNQDKDYDGWDFKLPSATELYEAGVKFKRSHQDGFMNISFDHGELRLPLLNVTDNTESYLLNYMAFEQLGGAWLGNDGTKVSSFVVFMEDLIDTAKDVQILQHARILKNGLGSDDQVAQLFNGITRGMMAYDGPQMKEVRSKLVKYCHRPCNKWRANLCHTYLRNPWTITSVVAGVVLLLLTFLQTLYSMLAYYKQPPQPHT
ncbi:hypothetical protein AMTRI_Chr06g169380 [Amborella trichopoda]